MPVGHAEAMKSWIRYMLLTLSAFVVLAVGAFAAVIAFDSPKTPPVLAAGDSVPGMAQWNFAEMPRQSSVVARDGAPLAYRLYPARADRAVVLVHGSSGSGLEMHKLAQALQAAGATVYAISLRGHGGSGTVNGDIAYKNQLDDDLADFVKAAGLADKQAHRTLIGFSSGGAFALRTASGPNHGLFDAYLSISPYIGQDSPTNKPNAGGWSSVAVPRLVALAILDGFGLPWFQGLPVVHFATAAKPDKNRTPVYSYRLVTGLHLSRDWRTELARIREPTQIMIGSNDELFNADRFPPLLQSLNPRIAVTVLPGPGHLNMIADAGAVSMVATMWRQMDDQARGR